MPNKPVKQLVYIPVIVTQKNVFIYDYIYFTRILLFYLVEGF